MSIQYKTKIEQKIEDFQSSFQLFIDTQKLASIALISCIVLSIILMNTAFISTYYKEFSHLLLGFHFDGMTTVFTLKEFVNDFLLVFFFLVLGLEIKREFVIGELADFSRASIVIMAAIGGILFPIIIFLMMNSSTEYQHGWAIATATDTAIAIGLMSLFKSKLPKGAFPFIAALAVLDDVAAITIIAIFYTSHLAMSYIFAAVIVTLGMVLANISGVRNALFYLLAGFVLWILFELGGIHGAIVGVIIAATIPARPKDKPSLFVSKMKVLLKRFERKHDSSQHILESKEQHSILEEVREESLKATTPLRRWEQKLELPVLLLILPLFALTNGALEINITIIEQAINTSLFWGIMLGLVLGKPLGISLFTYVSLVFKMGKLPSDMQMRDVLSISFLAGIGYTMSIFITDLAFDNGQYINYSKLAIVVGSLLSAIIATCIIYSHKNDERMD